MLPRATCSRRWTTTPKAFWARWCAGWTSRTSAASRTQRWRATSPRHRLTKRRPSWCSRGWRSICSRACTAAFESDCATAAHAILSRMRSILQSVSCALAILMGHASAQSTQPSEASIKRLEAKLTSVCLALPKDEPPFLSRLDKSEIVSSCRCAVPNVVRELIDNNIRDGGAAYYKVAAHMMICNENKLKPALTLEKMRQELASEKKYIFTRSTSDRVSCLVNQEYELYLDAYQTMTTPDRETVLRVIRECRQ